MRYPKDEEEIEKVEFYMTLAKQESLKSTCMKSQRGVVIIKDDELISKGHNKLTDERLCKVCLNRGFEINKKELCSAIHAEQMALLKSDRDKLKGSSMYHLETKDKESVYSREPSCTLCSRLLAFSGIKEFVLYKREGFIVYDSDEYNKLSYDYVLKNKL